MGNIQILRQKVLDLYESRSVGRAEWADWIYEGHVLLVAKESRIIAERFGGNVELAEAAALLHDIADAVLKRENPGHEERSLELARELLTASDYSPEEIAIIVDDALAKHSCRGDIRPETEEGKAMAAADAVAHLKSEFYMIAEKRRMAFQTPAQIAAWALPKIERDFTNKISYDELREEVRSYYNRYKDHFIALTN